MFFRFIFRLNIKQPFKAFILEHYWRAEAYPLTLILRHQHASTSLNLQAQLKQNVLIQTRVSRDISNTAATNRGTGNKFYAVNTQHFKSNLIFSTTCPIDYCYTDTIILSSYRKPVIMGRAEEGEKVFTQAQHGYLIYYITRNRRCTSVSGSACTSTYGIRKAYLLCRLLCWFWPQTSYNTDRQRSPTESENKMGKVRMLSSVNGTGHLWGQTGTKCMVTNSNKL